MTPTLFLSSINLLHNNLYFYETPIYDQSKLTVTNVAQFIPTTSNEHPEYKIIIHKDIVDKDNNIADSEDFEQVALDINDTYNFAITLKELNRIVTNTGTSLVESYNGYSGNVFNGIVTNKGDLRLHRSSHPACSSSGVCSGKSISVYRSFTSLSILPAYTERKSGYSKSKR